MRGNLLNAATTNARGTAVRWDYDGQVHLRERRIWIDPTSTIGGATVSIDVRQIGDTNWKPSGITFTAASAEPELLTLQPNDEVSANVTGGTGANITVGIA